MRFDEKTRFALEMLSRKRHRSSAGVVSDLIQQAAKTELDPPLEQLWAADPPNRFLNLVEKAPHLLDHTEEMVLTKLKLIDHIWRPIKFGSQLDDEDTALIECGSRRLLVGDGWSAIVDMFAFTECFDLLYAVAEGKMTIPQLQNEYAGRLFDEEDRPGTESISQLTERYRKKWEKLGGA
jgi:hypothetical protein